MSAIVQLRPALPAGAELCSSTQSAMPASAFDPEFAALLACCVSPSDEERIRQLVGSLDWRRLLRLAEHHRVVPRVYAALAAVPDLIPQTEWSTLRAAYVNNARKNLLLTTELIRILDHFESRGIEALALKGPVLAEMLYGNVAERQFGDLDVLVHVSDVAAAKAALLEIGYTPQLSLGCREQQEYLASGYEQAFRSSDGRVLLELQWQILPRFYAVDFDVPEIFSRATKVSLGGRALRTPCPEDLFLVLCVHAAKHMWQELSLLCDIVQLQRIKTIDWGRVGRQAKRMGIERIVGTNVLLARKLLAARVSAPVRAVISAENPMVEEIVLIIARSEEFDAESPAYFRWMLRLRERWRDRMRFLWRLLFTPGVGEWSTVNLPNELFGLYRIVRMFRLAKRAALR